MEDNNRIVGIIRELRALHAENRQAVKREDDIVRKYDAELKAARDSRRSIDSRIRELWGELESIVRDERDDE